jgi:hypothetical protein
VEHSCEVLFVISRGKEKPAVVGSRCFDINTDVWTFHGSLFTYGSLNRADWRLMQGDLSEMSSVKPDSSATRVVVPPPPDN